LDPQKRSGGMEWKLGGKGKTTKGPWIFLKGGERANLWEVAEWDQGTVGTVGKLGRVGDRLRRG